MRKHVVALASLVVACGPGTGEKGSSTSASVKVEWPQPDSSNRVTNLYRLTLGPEAASVPTCGTQTPVFAARDVGPIKTATSVADFMNACPNAKLVHYRDDFDQEWQGILVRLGKAIVLLEVDVRSSTITRVATADTSARTSAGVGPATSLQALKDKLGELKRWHEFCAVFVSGAATPGVSYRLTPAGPAEARDCELIPKMASDTSLVHPRTLVSLMYVDVNRPSTTQAGQQSGSQAGGEPEWLCRKDTILPPPAGVDPATLSNRQPEIRPEGALFIPLRNGGTVILPECPGGLHGEPRGHLSAARVYVVERSHEDTPSAANDWLLVHEYTGRIVRGSGRPMLSPDSAHVLSWAASTMEGDFYPGSLIVWQVTPDSLKQVFRFGAVYDTSAGPSSASWAGARTIDFWRVQWTSAGPGDSTRSRLVLDNGVWSEVKP